MLNIIIVSNYNTECTRVGRILILEILKHLWNIVYATYPE